MFLPSKPSNSGARTKRPPPLRAACHKSPWRGPSTPEVPLHAQISGASQDCPGRLFATGSMQRRWLQSSTAGDPKRRTIPPRPVMLWLRTARVGWGAPTGAQVRRSPQQRCAKLRLRALHPAEQHVPERRQAQGCREGGTLGRDPGGAAEELNSAALRSNAFPRPPRPSSGWQSWVRPSP